MDLEILHEFFEGYVQECRMNVPELPDDLVYSSQISLIGNSRIFTISGEGNPPAFWFDNATHVLTRRFPECSVQFHTYSESSFLIVISTDSTDVENISS